jgi:AbiV family abortive infection protein
MMTDFLLKGGWYALVQAGHLINHAGLLYDADAYSTAAGVALLSREELAKSRKLFWLWKRANHGEQITREHVEDELAMNHVEKQRYGQAHFTFQIGAPIMEALNRGKEADPAEYEKAVQRANAIIKRGLKGAPDARHLQRLRAFYVDPAMNGQWIRPSDITRDDAEHAILEARNDYSLSRPGMPGRAKDMESLEAALKAWHDKPRLPKAEPPRG